MAGDGRASDPVREQEDGRDRLAAWHQSWLTDDDRALALVDLAVDHLETALRHKRHFADAHALLGPLYSSYYQLAPRRAAGIGPMGDEHLEIALLQGPDNPRVVAARALDLLSSPAEYGGDKQAGMDD